MTRKHEIFVTDQGRIVYRISDLYTGQQISLRERSVSQAAISLVDLILEVTHDLGGFVLPPVTVWDERPRIALETRQDFEGHLTPIDDDFETMGRCM